MGGTSCPGGRAVRSIILLNNEDLPKWEGYCELVWQNLLAPLFPGASWKTLQAPMGHLPTVEEVAAADLFVLSGSHYSAYETHDWIMRLRELIPQWVATGTPMVCGCFGHQICAMALGGEVGKNPSGRFVLKVEDIELQRNSLEACGLLSAWEGLAAGAEASAPAAPAAAAAAGEEPLPAAGAEEGSSSRKEGSSGDSKLVVRMMESHGDCVTQLPPGALLLASSATAAHEIFVYGSNVLCFQAHPELEPDLVLEKIWRPLSDVGRLSPEESAASEANLKQVQHQGGRWARLIKHFAEHGLVDTSRRSEQATAQHISSTAPAAATAARGAVGTAGAGAAGAGQQATAAAAAAAAGAAGKEAAQALEQLAGHVREAVDAGLEEARVPYETLAKMNGAAAEQYSAAADVAGALADFSISLKVGQAGVAKAMAQKLGALEQQVDQLGRVVDALDTQSKVLAKEVGVPEGGGAFSWARSS